MANQTVQQIAELMKARGKGQRGKKQQEQPKKETFEQAIARWKAARDEEKSS